jgi:tyrosyl-tRNA synthetase
MRLAFEIVMAFYSREEAENAQRNFVETFQKGGLPDAMAEFRLDASLTITDLMIQAGLVKSKNEGRRLIDQKGVKFEGRIILDPSEILHSPGVLQVGKRHFLRLIK